MSLFLFDGGLKDNSYMCHEVAVIAQRSGNQLCVTNFSVVCNADQNAPWYRRRGFGCAGNVETLLVLTVDISLGQMQKKTPLCRREHLVLERAVLFAAAPPIESSTDEC